MLGLKLIHVSKMGSQVVGDKRKKMRYDNDTFTHETMW